MDVKLIGKIIKQINKNHILVVLIRKKIKREKEKEKGYIEIWVVVSIYQGKRCIFRGCFVFKRKLY